MIGFLFESPEKHAAYLYIGQEKYFLLHSDIINYKSHNITCRITKCSVDCNKNACQRTTVNI